MFLFLPAGLIWGLEAWFKRKILVCLYIGLCGIELQCFHTSAYWSDHIILFVGTRIYCIRYGLKWSAKQFILNFLYYVCFWRLPNVSLEFNGGFYTVCLRPSHLWSLGSWPRRCCPCWGDLKFHLKPNWTLKYSIIFVNYCSIFYILHTTSNILI